MLNTTLGIMGLGTQEIILIIVAILLLFGGKKSLNLCAGWERSERIQRRSKRRPGFQRKRRIATIIKSEQRIFYYIEDPFLVICTFLLPTDKEPFHEILL